MFYFVNPLLNLTVLFKVVFSNHWLRGQTEAVRQFDNKVFRPAGKLIKKNYFPMIIPHSAWVIVWFSAKAHILFFFHFTVSQSSLKQAALSCATCYYKHFSYNQQHSDSFKMTESKTIDYSWLGINAAASCLICK